MSLHIYISVTSACGASVVVHRFIFCPAPPVSYKGADSSSSCSTSTPAPSSQPGKVVEDGSSAQDPSIHVGDPEQAPVSWLWICSAPVFVATWRVKQWMENVPLSA